MAKARMAPVTGLKTGDFEVFDMRKDSKERYGAEPEQQLGLETHDYP
jgi:hypothetical protein